MFIYLSEFETADDLDNMGDQVLEKAVIAFRKRMERDDLTDEQREEIELRAKAMEARDVIEYNEEHTATEIVSEGDARRVLIGPPTLTRFEKARIMGARALQLSMGAPPFVDLTSDIKTSLAIAQEELNLRVIPIVIRRALPNGDFQNIPIGYFN